MVSYISGSGSISVPSVLVYFFSDYFITLTFLELIYTVILYLGFLIPTNEHGFSEDPDKFDFHSYCLL